MGNCARREEDNDNKSLDVRNQGPTTFQWPQNANVLESARPTTSTVLSSALEEKLKESPKPKRKQGNKKNNNVKEKKTVESVSRYEKKERKEKKEKGTMIRTGGWSNPAWKMV